MTGERGGGGGGGGWRTWADKAGVGLNVEALVFQALVLLHSKNYIPVPSATIALSWMYFFD